MKSRWNDGDSARYVEAARAAGQSEALGLRIYTSRIIGGDPDLVLHGGGNTSVKTTVKDQLGEDVDVICIKGSGWDMGVIVAALLSVPFVNLIAPVLGAAMATHQFHGRRK